MIENSNGLYADIHIAHTLDDTLALAESAGLGLCVELQFCWVESGLEQTVPPGPPADRAGAGQRLRARRPRGARAGGAG